MPDNAAAGATPAADGATPSQTPPAQPAATDPTTPPTSPTTSATGDGDEPLGPGGTRALEAERTARRDAEREAREAKTALEELKRQGLSDSERAVAEARAAGKAESTERFHAQIRRSEVKSALAGAGIRTSVMDLAVKADEFAKLPINDDGDVEGLDEAVKAFKKGRPDLFGQAAGDGTADGGARDTAAPPAKDLATALDRHYAGKG